MMQALYSAVGTLGTPLIRAWLNKRIQRGKEDPARIQERFGYASQPRPSGTLIWLHAASVGEAQSVLTLARALLAQHPTTTLLVTTGTVTSATMLASQIMPGMIHQYVPVDTYGAVKRFLHHWKPDLALWVESEFWPQLLLQTHAKHIPLLLINARLSARSEASWQRWPRHIKTILNCFNTIFAGANEDAQRLKNLGATQVVEAGNLKYDAAPLHVNEAALAPLHTMVGARPLWLCASTHANEESMVAQAHRTVMQTHPTALCIIVPRHAARGDSIAAALRAQGFTIAQRSKNEQPDSSTSLYLADTMGELGSFYSLAPLVFLGGSLIAHGGHNPLEPARQHCAIVSGPHIHNFASIMDQFSAANAIVLVADSDALAQHISACLTTPAQATAMAERAYGVTQKTKGATAAILARIAELLT